MSRNPITIRLLANTTCEFRATACAHRYQRIQITADGTTKTLYGGSSRNRLPMRLSDGRTETITLPAKPHDRDYTLRFEYEDGNRVWQFSTVKDPVYSSSGSTITHIFRTEDGGDTDYSDTELTVTLTR